LPLYAHDLPAEKRTSVYEIDLRSSRSYLQGGLETADAGTDDQNTLLYILLYILLHILSHAFTT
jgi:hypothetical protein